MREIIWNFRFSLLPARVNRCIWHPRHSFAAIIYGDQRIAPGGAYPVLLDDWLVLYHANQSHIMTTHFTDHDPILSQAAKRQQGQAVSATDLTQGITVPSTSY